MHSGPQTLHSPLRVLRQLGKWKADTFKDDQVTLHPNFGLKSFVCVIRPWVARSFLSHKWRRKEGGWLKEKVCIFLSGHCFSSGGTVTVVVERDARLGFCPNFTQVVSCISYLFWWEESEKGLWDTASAQRKRSKWSSSHLSFSCGAGGGCGGSEPIEAIMMWWEEPWPGRRGPWATEHGTGCSGSQGLDQLWEESYSCILWHILP